jgi:Tol biopolymer transport system component
MGSRLLSLVVLLHGLPFVTACIKDDSWNNFKKGAHFDLASPSVSPDGEWVVFASPRTGHGDIYRMRLSGADRTRLTDNPCFECNPLYSEDGRTIFFVREEEGQRHVWRMDEGGANEAKITSANASDDLQAVSADGKWLLVGRSTHGGGLGRVGQTILLPVDPNDPTSVPLGYYASFSPDGLTVLFSPTRDELWSLDLITLDRKRIGSGNLPRFFPDGKRILFLPVGSSSIWTGNWRSMMPDGSDESAVGTGTYALIAPDCQHVVYLSSDYQFDLLRGTIGDGHTTRLDGPAGYKTWARPCRDGFVFTVFREDNAGEIFLLNTKGWVVTPVGPVR